jgi:carotenoid cleavage dioxygenase-like enzyme
MKKRIVLSAALMIGTSCFASSLYHNQEEILQDKVLTVSGQIPDWVQGEFVRNVPGLKKGKSTEIKHWFDGLAKLHVFTINHGKITYKCKFLASDAYKKYQDTGEVDFIGFAQKAKPDSSLIMGSSDLKDPIIQNANVNVFKINNQRVALTETPLPVVFGKDLKTLGTFDYADNLPKSLCFETAHMLQDPDTKAVWNFLINLEPGKKLAYQIYNIPDQSSERKVVASIDVPSISYMHSFSLAGKYVVLTGYPFQAKDPLDLTKGFINNFSWSENETTFYVIDKKSGECKTFTKNPFFSFHHINGFENEGKIYLDLIAYQTANVIYKPNDPICGQLCRFEMDLSKNTIKDSKLPDLKIEFPRLNESYIGKPYQYFYAVHNPGGGEGDGLVKYDLLESKYTCWNKPGSYATEPVFIPHPDAKSEDEGVILSVVNDFVKKKSFLLILDGKGFKELAKVYTPHLIPYGFHGQFFKE